MANPKWHLRGLPEQDIDAGRAAAAFAGDSTLFHPLHFRAAPAPWPIDFGEFPLLDTARSRADLEVREPLPVRNQSDSQSPSRTRKVRGAPRLGDETYAWLVEKVRIAHGAH
jgi:hypothetical protein